MTFKTLIRRHACKSGQDYCKLHGYDLGEILKTKNAAAYQEEHGQTVPSGIASTINEWSFVLWVSDPSGTKYHALFQHLSAALRIIDAAENFDAAAAGRRKANAAVRKLLKAAGVTWKQ
jgi:hypothetical protein